MMIKFVLMTITPDMARMWLQNHNEGNRGIKTVVVQKYSRDIKDARWRVTHQCVAFDASGNLVDGQHRLSAVVLADKAMVAYVATYETNEQTLKLPIDMQAKRSVFEVLHVTRQDQETVSAAMRVIRKHGALASMTEIETCIRNARNELDTVNTCISSKVKYRSAAPARAAIMCLLHEYPDRAEYITTIYRAFVSMDLADLPSSVLALLKNLDKGGVKSGTEQRDLLLRTYYAFSPPNFGVKSIRLSDPDLLLRHIRATSDWLMA